MVYRCFCLLGLLLPWLALAARDVPPPYDPAGRVALLGQVLSRHNEYELVSVDDFQGEMPYSPRANSTDLSVVRTIQRSPTDDAFSQEESLRGDPSGEPSCLWLHTSFDLPGQQSYWLRPRDPVRLQGRLILVSLWVHSGSWPHTLTLLFENAAGREVRVPLGRLDFHGWRRLEAYLPETLWQRGPIERPYVHHFTGFLIESSPRAEAGAVSLLFDNLLVLSDHSQGRYPGAEVPDNWP